MMFIYGSLNLGRQLEREFTSSWWWCCTPGTPICWEINRGHPHPFLGEFNLGGLAHRFSMHSHGLLLLAEKVCAVVHIFLQINMHLDILPSKCHWVFTLSRTVGGWFWWKWKNDFGTSPALEGCHCGVCWEWQFFRHSLASVPQILSPRWSLIF